MASAALSVLVIITALSGALHPCSLSVLLLLGTDTAGNGQSKKRLLGLCLTYVLTLTIILYLIGIILVSIVHWLPLLVSHYLELVVAVLIVTTGLLEIKQFFWYEQGTGLRLSNSALRRIQSLLTGKITHFRALQLGVVASLTLLPCLGASYATAVLLLKGNFTLLSVNVWTIYMIAFALPLLVVCFLMSSSIKLSKLHQSIQNARAKLRLVIGLVLIILGWLLMLDTAGVINFG